YRVVPLGIFYRPFAKDGVDELKNSAEISAMFTHNSEISKVGAAITALIIGNLMHGILPERAVNGALGIVGETDKTKLLIQKIRQAIDMGKVESIESARKTFGTGSPIYQTLPLAIFCFLKFQNNFEKAVIAAANSYRDDTPEEKTRLKKFSWEEQLQYAKGGNTDGIAGLAGAFAGAHLGLEKIPRKFLDIENEEKLVSLTRKLVWFP
ncbi:MAG: ADP-ribosylglycohydrolase family protein, partial [bacterium]|nr:ADP-ribosylglycohydrolase family protein [bacterium]